MFDDREQALKYYAAFLEKYGYECPHDSTSNTYATDNDDSTSYALVSSVCDLCGKQLELSKAPAVNNIANVEGYIHGANPGTYTTPYVFGPGSSKYPEAGYMTPGAGKTVALSGWGGAIGSVTKTAYRVLDADGNEVIGWTVYNNVDLNPSDISGIKGQVAGLVPDYGSAFRFNITADLSSLYTAENYGEMFTVEFAYIADDAEGNDKYLVCGIFENVMIPDPEA